MGDTVMPLMSKLATTVTLSDGATVTLHLPSLRTLEKAKQVTMRQAMDLMTGLDPAVIASIPRDTAAQETDDPGYDWYTLLCDCITAWSYEEAVTPEAVADLDQESVEQLVKALFPVTTPEQRKNGSGRSTPH